MSKRRQWRVSLLSVTEITGSPFRVSSLEAHVWFDESMSLRTGDTRHRRSFMTKKSTESDERKTASAVAEASKGFWASTCPSALEWASFHPTMARLTQGARSAFAVLG